jgi:hypothetical protein
MNNCILENYDNNDNKKNLTIVVSVFTVLTFICLIIFAFSYNTQVFKTQKDNVEGFCMIFGIVCLIVTVISGGILGTHNTVTDSNYR